MKRIKCILTSIVILLSFHASAQDIIVTTKGESIKCVIQSENEIEVTYVVWKDKSEKVKTLPMSSVWSISLDPGINRVALQSKASTSSNLVTQKPAVTSRTTTSSTKATSVKPIKNPRKSKYAWQGVGWLFGGVVAYGGGLALAVNSETDTGMVVGIVAAVGGLIVGESFAIHRFIKSISEPKYVSLDVPLNDRLSVGVYNYAMVPKQTNGAGLGLKINF